MSLSTLSTMRRRLLALTIATLGLAACGDSATAPATPESAVSLTPTQRSMQSVVAVGDTIVSTFTYYPTIAYDLPFGNGHRLTIPVGTMCEPLTSGYGPALWDAPCVPLARPLQFAVRTWRDGAGRPRVTVTPDVRFVPGRHATLRLQDASAASTTGSVIAWCPTGAATCVDESRNDASLQTSTQSGYVYRRLKHFSGYTVVVDRSGDDSGFGF